MGRRYGPFIMFTDGKPRLWQLRLGGLMVTVSDGARPLVVWCGGHRLWPNPRWNARKHMYDR